MLLVGAGAGAGGIRGRFGGGDLIIPAGCDPKDRVSRAL